MRRAAAGPLPAPPERLRRSDHGGLGSQTLTSRAARHLDGDRTGDSGSPPSSAVGRSRAASPTAAVSSAGRPPPPSHLVECLPSMKAGSASSHLAGIVLRTPSISNSGQRPQHPPPGGLPVRAPGDELGREVVVVRDTSSRRRSRRRPRTPNPSGPVELRERPGEGGTRWPGPSALMRHSMAWPRRSIESWVKESLAPARHPQLFLTRSMAGDELGHAVPTWRGV